jgi:hypothetical protein
VIFEGSDRGKTAVEQVMSDDDEKKNDPRIGAVRFPDSIVGEAQKSALARLFSAPQAPTKSAPPPEPEQMTEVVAKQAAQIREQAAGIEQQRAVINRLRQERVELIAERDRLVGDQEQLVEERDRAAMERDQLRVARDRLIAELRALRGARGRVPRTSGELRAWRQDRVLTQIEAAERLGVGHATVERAEAKGDDAPLGRALRLALERDAEATKESAKAAMVQAAPTKKADARGKKRRR